MKLKSILFIAFLTFTTPAWSSDKAVPLKSGDLISFYNPFLKHYDYGVVQSVDADGILTFRVRVIHSNLDSNYISYENYLTPVNQVGISVADLNGFKPGQKVCFKKEKGKLKAVFSNGVALLMIGDFFGYDFGIFERPKVVDLSQLTLCKL